MNGPMRFLLSLPTIWRNSSQSRGGIQVSKSPAYDPLLFFFKGGKKMILSVNNLASKKVAFFFFFCRPLKSSSLDGVCFGQFVCMRVFFFFFFFFSFFSFFLRTIYVTVLSTIPFGRPLSTGPTLGRSLSIQKKRKSAERKCSRILRYLFPTPAFGCRLCYNVICYYYYLEQYYKWIGPSPPFCVPLFFFFL